MKQDETMLTLKGKGNRCGVAIGKTEFLPKRDFVASSPAGETRRELARFEAAKKSSRDELLCIYRSFSSEVSEGEAWIFLLQIYLLDGSLFSRNPQFYISEGKSAEEALLLSLDEFLRSASHSSFMSAVMEDARDVARRIMRHLTGSEEKSPSNEDCILLCDSPTPSQVYEFRSTLSGIVASSQWERTGAAALAHTLFIPVVFIDSDISECDACKSAIIDSSSGAVYIQPDLAALEIFSKSQKKEAARKKCEKRKNGLPLLADCSSIFEAKRLRESELCGIGLFRSEELYLSSCTTPDEDSLYESYRTLAETLFPKPLVIRTFSIPCGTHINRLTAIDESEPELYVFEGEMLKNQLRAIMRAAVFTTVAIAVPCKNSYAEITRINQLIPRLCDELTIEGKDHRAVPLGIIIDSPAAAIVSDTLLDTCDFAIVQVNSLSMDDQSDISHDAEARLLESTARIAKRKKKPSLLLLGENTAPSLICTAKRLGFSALVVPPDSSHLFS